MNKNTTRTSRIACALGAGALLALGALSAPAAATAAPATQQSALTATEQSDLAQFWTDNGVDQATQDKLLANVDAGIMPQSVVGGAEPTSTSSTDAEGTTTTTDVYPDGSLSVSSAEYPVTFAEGEVGTRAITGCEAVTGSGFAQRNNCNVSGTNGVVSLGFIASYTLVNGGYDYITNHHTPLILLCAPGTCSDPGFTQYVEREGVNGPAGVTMTTVYSAADYGSISNILNLQVGGDAASTSFSPSVIE